MPRLDGFFRHGSPVVSVLISADAGSPQRPLEAVIDTGFDGAVRIPNDWAPEIGLKSTDTVTEQEVADGRVVPVALAYGCMTLGQESRNILIVDVLAGSVALLDDVAEAQ